MKHQSPANINEYKLKYSECIQNAQNTWILEVLYIL